MHKTTMRRSLFSLVAVAISACAAHGQEFQVVKVPAVNGVFFDVVDSLLGTLGIHELDTYCGYDLFRFWQDTSGVCPVSP